MVSEEISIDKITAIAKAARAAGWDFNADELQEAYLDSLALDEGELTSEEAELVIEELEEVHKGELSDEELDAVSGGYGCEAANTYETVSWGTQWEVQFLFNEGAIVEAFPKLNKHNTATCKVVNRRTYQVESGWCDQYWLEKEPGSKTPFIKGWYYRSSIQK